MAEKIQVTLSNNKTIPVKKGITVKELVQNYYIGDEKVLAANVDNKLRTLDFELSKNCNVTFSTYSTSEGRSVYRRSIAFLLVMTVREMWRNGRLQVHHSLSNAFYYDLKIDIPLK